MNTTSIYYIYLHILYTSVVAVVVQSLSCIQLFVTPWTEEQQASLSVTPQICPNSCPLWRRQWHPTPVLLPGKSYGWRSLVGCSPRGREESDTTQQIHFHFPLSCIGEGHGNPLQCSCLENPRDRGAWWAAIYGVAQSRTRLKRLSSSSSSMSIESMMPPIDTTYIYRCL